jgi:hypothetical protein
VNVIFVEEFKKNAIAAIHRNNETKTANHHVIHRRRRHYILISLVNTLIVSFDVNRIFSLQVDAESLHHESRHASDDPNTTNIFINTIPRAVRTRKKRVSPCHHNNVDE